MNTGITIDPKVCNGKPVITGTRIPVTVILDQLAEGGSVDEVLNQYPNLTREQVADALRYCHSMIDHTEIESKAA